MPVYHFTPPHAMGYIELPEGIRIFAPISGWKGKQLKIGMEMELIIDTLWEKDKNEIRVKFTQDDVHEYHLVSVSDNGVGIPADMIPKIFDLGFTAANGNSDSAGTGIGLWECKKIIENAGGKIWVESDVGKGSTFYFTIPYEVCKNS